MKILASLIILVAPLGTLLGQTVTDTGTTSSSSATYSQPQHGGSGGTDGSNASGGIGEEFTLSATDPTLELTNLIVKSSGNANAAGTQTITFSLNLYNITTSTVIALSFPSVAVTNGDYLNFALNLTQPQGLLIGGDTYAFSFTSNASYYLGGILKSNESPTGFLPSGISSEFAVSGDGTGSSLAEIGGTSTPADATYFLVTQAAASPEPTSLALDLIGLVAFLSVWKFRLFRAAQTA